MRSRNILPNLMNFLGAVMITALVLAGLPVQSVFATGMDLYVATTGSNAGPNNCQTQASPCLTVMYAVSRAASNDSIHIAAGSYNENIQFHDINLAFIGAGMDQTILDGGGTHGLIYFYGASTVASFTDLTIQNGNNTTDGGGIINNGSTLTLTRVKVTNNTAPNAGGIDSTGSLTIVDSVISNNTANDGVIGYGGGLKVDATIPASISGTTISGNTATGSGGGIYVQGTSAALSLTNVTISGNTAKNGGGIGSNVTINILNSTIANNHLSGGSTGGILNWGTINFKNTIIAGNDAPNCANSGTLNSQGNNLDSGTTCNFIQPGDLQSTDPQLGALGDNGGLTQTHALPLGSLAIDAGTNTGCPTADQRGAPRPYVSTCDIGAFEYFRPTISGNAGIGDAQLAYSDGGLDKVALADAGGHYSFTVSDNWSDAVSPYKSGYTFTPDHKDYAHLVTDQPNQDYTAAVTVYTATYRSVGMYDGWILESGENTNLGGSMNATANTFRIGDDATKKQYRGVLSFNTSTLLDNAVITKVTLKVRKQGILGGGNPVATFQGFMVDIKKGFFGTTALQTTDFQTAAHKTYGPFMTALNGGWYSIDLTGAKAYINKFSTLSGLTQIRLRFQLDDNNNTIANYLNLYSGNAPAASRPQLIIQYYVP
jgi:predicted outer membrane repeat protein